jgi:ubiquinone/menaquinone biosynthesis C-methylase UbiE
MNFWDILVCPKCQRSFSESDIKDKGSKEYIVCKSCSERYPLINGAIDFGSVGSSLSNINWSRQEFEKSYEKLGDWDSSYDWGRKSGLPENATRYIYARVKGKILDMLKLQRGNRILDLGCGNGYFTIEMYDKFFAKVGELTYLGLDVSKHNIMNFQKKIKRREIINMDIFIGRAEMLPFKSNSINCITCSEVLEHIEDKELALKEVYRILAPGGTFLFSTPSKQGYDNWNAILFPLKLGRNLFRFILRRGKQTRPRPFDRPMSQIKYMTFLNEIGFKNIKLDTGQLLCDPIAKYIPRFLLNTYISLTNLMENNIPIMRKLFGLNIIGSARK